MAPTREPVLVHAGQRAAAEAALAAHRARTGRAPNLLVILMDDVGWGDFGCYGGGVAVGAPTPNIDRLAREGLLLTSCYSEPSCTPSRASLHDRPAADAPRPAARRRCTASRAGCRARSPSPELLSDAGYVTQAVGKWHMGENVESQPQNVGFDDFYGFLSRVRHVHRVARPVLLPRGRLQRGAHRVGREPAVQQVLRARRRAAARPRTVEEVTIPVLSAARRQVGELLGGVHPAHGRRRTQPWFLYHCTRGAHFDNYPHERFLGSSPAKHPYKDTHRRARRHRRPARRRARRDRPARGHARLRLVRQRARDGDVARRRVHAVPLRQGLDVGGRRAGARRLSVAGDDRRRSRVRRAVLVQPTCSPTVLDAGRRGRRVPDRPLHRRRRPDLVPARAATACRTASTTTTGCSRHGRPAGR